MVREPRVIHDLMRVAEHGPWSDQRLHEGQLGHARRVNSSGVAVGASVRLTVEPTHVFPLS